MHKKIENFADKNSQKKNIKELKNHTQKNNKIADAVVLVVLFLFFMFYVTYVTGQNLHVYSQQYLPYTSVNSSSENLGFKSNNISNWYLSLPPPPPPPPPFCLKCIAVVRRSFFLVSAAVERIKQDEQLLMCNWSDSRQGENALNTKLLQFLSFIKLCDSKSSDLTLSLPCVTKTEFLLTISIQHQTGKWWEYRKISLREL